MFGFNEKEMQEAEKLADLFDRLRKYAVDSGVHVIVETAYVHDEHDSTALTCDVTGNGLSILDYIDLIRTNEKPSKLVSMLNSESNQKLDVVVPIGYSSMRDGVRQIHGKVLSKDPTLRLPDLRPDFDSYRRGEMPMITSGIGRYEVMLTDVKELTNEEFMLMVSRQSLKSHNPVLLNEYSRRYAEDGEFKVMVDNVCAKLMIDNPDQAAERFRQIGPKTWQTLTDEVFVVPPKTEVLLHIDSITGFGARHDTLVEIWPTELEADEVFIGDRKVGGKKPHEKVAYSKRGFDGKPKKGWQRNGGKW